MAKKAELFPDPHFDYEHNLLKNLPGLTDQKLLDDFERIQATKALVNLWSKPVLDNFDTAHLKAIHARIFQRIYPWAGEFRRVNLHRSGSYYFAVVQFMEENLKRTFEKLASENHLRGLDAVAFAHRAASIPSVKAMGARNANSFENWLQAQVYASTGIESAASKCTVHRLKATVSARMTP